MNPFLSRSAPAVLLFALAAASAPQALQQPASRVQMPLFDTFTEFDTGSALVQRMPIMAAYGDVDGDRKIDAVIASAEWYQPKLTVLRNAGNLKFNSRKMYATAKPSGGVVLVDVDKDGDLDAVLAEPDQYGSGTTIGVYRNNGAGAFGSRTAYPAGAGPVSPVAADFDQDGNMDVAKLV